MEHQGHILDASTAALWRMDAQRVGADPLYQPDLANGCDLLADAGTDSEAGLISRAMLGTNHMARVAPDSKLDALAAVLAGGAFTFESWINIAVIPETDGGGTLFVFGDPGEGRRPLYVDAFGGELSGSLTAEWWDDGLGEYWHDSAYDLPELAAGSWVHVAIRVRPTEPGIGSVDLFLNGQVKYTWDGVLLQAGTGTVPSLMVGESFDGLIDDTRISSIARTDAEIIESYQRGMGIVPEPSAPDPILTPENVVQPTGRNLLLGSDGDLVISKGQLQLVPKLESIAQAVQCRLRLFQGEWFLDTSIGVPYLQQVFVKGPNLPLVRSLLRKTILETPGVRAVQSLTFDFDRASRNGSGTFTASTDLGLLENQPITL